MLPKLKICIIGGGLSGLSFIEGMGNGNLRANYTLFQRNDAIGGRATTKLIKMGQNCSLLKGDFGANIIQFDAQQSQTYLRKKMGNLMENLLPFQKQFLIFQKGIVKKPDYTKKRYYYQGGFHTLANHLLTRANFNHHSKQSSIEIVYNANVTQIKRQDKWIISYDLTLNKQTIKTHDSYDYLVIAAPPHQIAPLMKRGQYLGQFYDIFEEFSESSRYTKQICGIYKCGKGIKFSSMLFKNHELTFICSSEQKHCDNEENLVCVQMNVKFSQEFFAEEEEIISKAIYQFVPDDIKQQISLIESEAKIYKWKTSLLIPQQPSLLLRFNQKLIKLEEQARCSIIGDATMGKSRVTNALISGYRASQRLIHFFK